jgi:hypothetical protein
MAEIFENHLWKLSDVFGSADERELGIAVRAMFVGEDGRVI